MAWRIHITNQAIKTLNILPGKKPILVAWLRRDRALCYDLNTGTDMGEINLIDIPPLDRTSTAWQSFLEKLTGPGNRSFLPFIQTPTGDVYTTDDGRLRLYHTGDTRLVVEIDSKGYPLDMGDARDLIALDMDRALGTIVALDDKRRLHIFQQDLRVGVFDVGLRSDTDMRGGVAVSRGGGNIFATDGRRLVVTDAAGEIMHTKDLHYFVGRLSCSPGGAMLATSDMETGVLRLYQSETLTLTHQKFAIDLMADASQVQLMADLPHTGTAVGTLVAYNRGVIAFAMSGVICVSHVSRMDELPRPRALL